MARARSKPTTPFSVRPVQPPAKRPEYERGKEWPVERLTGVRVQKGKTGNGMAKWTYEVVWKACEGKTHPNTFEPPEHLIGFEVEMKQVDEEIMSRAGQMFQKPVAVANEAKELAAAKKADELAAARERLLRTQRLRTQRLRRRSGEGGDTTEDPPVSDDDDDVDEEQPEEFAEFDEEQLAAELLRMEELLRQHGRCITTEQEAAQGTTAEDAAKTRKQGPSRVWLCFRFKTNRCMLRHPADKTRECGAAPQKGTGTSGHIQHLRRVHGPEWTEVLATGELKSAVQMIDDALAAKVDISKPALGTKETAELHRLVALWIAKCGRPQAIVEDHELNMLVARILELCKARFRFALPCRQTMEKELTLLGHEGKAIGHDFIVRLINSGVRPSITGDLWSEGGMGLFGIFAHGITETWVMEKALIGLVACEAERHTAVNIKKWTEEALVAIGLSTKDLLAP